MTDTSAFPAPHPPGSVSASLTPQRTHLRDIVFGWRSVLAVLLAGIIVGGLVGASITLLIDHHGSRPTIQFPGGSTGGTGGTGSFGQGFEGFGQDGAGGTGGLPQGGGSDGSGTTPQDGSGSLPQGGDEYQQGLG